MAVRGDRDLERAFAVHGGEPEVTERRHVGHIHGDPALSGDGGHFAADGGVVDRRHDHVGSVDVARYPGPRSPPDFAPGRPGSQFRAEFGGDHGHVRIGFESGAYPTGSDQAAAHDENLLGPEAPADHQGRASLRGRDVDRVVSHGRASRGFLPRLMTGEGVGRFILAVSAWASSTNSPASVARRRTRSPWTSSAGSDQALRKYAPVAS